VPGLPEPTVAAIVGRADGIPLYAVETVRMLVADGRLREADGTYEVAGDLATLAVPETLTALIGARLDALEPIDRALLQDAAVLGQSFTVAGLAAISGKEAPEVERRLSALVRREILSSRVDPRSPERGQFAFVQALIREVAYNTLTKRDRRERHLAAARFFESLGTDELAGALAGHYLSAYENSPAGPEADALAIQARLALIGAADRASALGSPSQALVFIEQALTIEIEAGQQPELLERAANVAMAAGLYARAEELARRAMDRFIAAGERPAEARMVSIISRAQASLLHAVEAMEFAAEAVGRFADLVGRPEHVDLLLRVANGYWLSDDNENAVQWADRALAEAEQYDLVPQIVDGLIVKGGALGYLGRGYEGIGTMRGAFSLAEAHGHYQGMLRAQANLSDAQIARDPRAALETARAGLDGARRFGRNDYLGVMVLNGTSVAYRTGDWDWIGDQARDLEASAVNEVDRASGTVASVVVAAARGEDVTERLASIERVLTAGSDNQARALSLDTVAAVAFAQGRLDDAYRDEMAAAAMISWLAPTAYLTAARSALRLHDAERALAALDKLKATTHGPAISAACLTIEAGLAALDGRPGESVVQYRAALDAWSELGLVLDVGLTAIDMAALLDADGADVEAAAQAARGIFARLGARTFLAQLSAVTALADGVDAGPADGAVQGLSSRARAATTDASPAGRSQ
jgi:tetratricopeptide (TPR) repeat protein